MLWTVFLFIASLLLLLARRLNRRRRTRAARWPRRAYATLTLATALLSACCFSATAIAYWYTHRTPTTPLQRALFRGIDYERQTRTAPRPMAIHVATVDLRAPGLSFLVTPGQPTDDRDLPARSTSAFLEEFHLQFAVNANYFYPFRSKSPWNYLPHAGEGVTLCGFAASRGQIYSDRHWSAGTLYLSATNDATFDEPDGDIYNAISGNGFVLRAGQVPPPPLMADEKDEPYPRAGVGLSRDRRRLIFVIIDGKQPGYSEGATLQELGQILRDHGAHDAIRLDEGGSCAMATESRPGHARLLNVPINNRIPYRERVVANHLGVYAQRLK